jgi:hypothetical protein
MDKLTLNGRTFAFRPLPAVEAVKLFVALVSIVGEPLFAAFVKAEGKGDAETLGAALIGSLSGKLDPTAVAGHMSTVFSAATCDGAAIIFESTFSERRTMEAFRVFLAGLRYQYADFFDAAPLLSGLLKSKAGLS